MPVRFVIGRSGSGKTTHCLGAIVDLLRAEPLGSPIFWLLPRQSTFLAERQLVTETDLPAVCRVRVESFDGLAKLILADCGGAAIPQVSGTGRRLILSHLLRKKQSQLKFFAGVAHHPGLAETLDATFAEFERSGHAPQQVIDALQAQSDDTDSDDTLRAKLGDLHILYDAYTEFLGQDRLDPHRRNEQVVERMGESKLIRGATVFIDGFYDYTESERRMIGGLATVCKQVDITVLADPAAKVFYSFDQLPDESSLFHRTEDAYRTLAIALRKVKAAIEPPIVLKETHRFRDPSLSTIERSVFDGNSVANPSVSAEVPAVTFMEADDLTAEVDAAARHVLSLLRNGHRMRDIAVLVRDLNTYQDLVDASFREHGITFFLDRRRAAAHHPLLRLVRSILTIASNGWPTAAMFTLVKTGLAGLSLTQADELENYALDHRIRATDWPAAEPWNFDRQLTRDSEDDITSRAERATKIDGYRRQVVDAVKPFVNMCQNRAAVHTARTFADGLFALLTKLGTPVTLSGWIAESTRDQQFEQAAEHTQVWAEFVEMLDEFVDLLGDEPMTTDTFIDLLGTRLDAFDLALAPPMLDGALVGQVGRTRLPEVRAVIVLGLSDGQFPKTPREDSILSDRDRNLLRQGEVSLRGDGGRQLLDERLLGYVAFTAASESLYCSRVACDTVTGKPLAESPYWARLRSIVPTAPVEHVGASTTHAGEDVSLIATPRQLIVSLMQWARRPDSDPSTNATLASLYQWLATRPADDTAVARLRFHAWGALRHSNNASLRPEISKAMFTGPIDATVSRLETFAACPFKHFVQYGLRIERRSDDGFSSLDLSRVYHNLLERFVRGMIRSRKTFRDLTNDWTDAQIATAATQIGVELRKDLAMDAGQSRYLLSRIERTLKQVIDRQQAVASHSALNSGFVGVSFGGEESSIGPLRLSTSKGPQVNLRGRIDRIDVLGTLQQDGPQQAAVFDYKLSADKLSPAAIYHGLSLQLLTYLLVLQTNGHELTGAPLTPAAGFYVSLLRKLELVAHPDEAVDPETEEFRLSPKSRGIFNADSLHLLDPDFVEGKSMVWQVSRNKTGEFGNRNASDVCDADDFLAILSFVRRKLETLAESMVSGKIDVSPYRIGKTSPCSRCGFMSICRFDVTTNKYNRLIGVGRDELIAQAKKETE